MTAFDALYKTGSVHYLIQHLGNPDTTLVTAQLPIVASFGDRCIPPRIPDLLVAFDVDPKTYEECNGYVVSQHGKPADFVLEVASAATALMDLFIKREDYAALGIPEYWRFDITGEHYGAKLAGDFLVDGSYRPAELYQPEPGLLQGYSPALDLNLRWDRGRLLWLDPTTEAPIPDYEHQKARYERARDEAQRIPLERAVERLQRLVEENHRRRDD